MTQTNPQPYRDNAEPPVEELLADPILQKLMASDKVDMALLKQLQAHIVALRDQLGTTDSLQ
jgi:hypothetical protein